jgi:hypothetical protein
VAISCDDVCESSRLELGSGTPRVDTTIVDLVKTTDFANVESIVVLSVTNSIANTTEPQQSLLETVVGHREFVVKGYEIRDLYEQIY